MFAFGSYIDVDLFYICR